MNVAGEQAEEPQISLGVVENWQWPDMLDGLTAEISDGAVARMRERPYRTSPQANDWGGCAVADAAGLTLRKGDPHRPHNMARVRAWLDALERDGRIIRVEGNDTTAKRKVEFYEVTNAA